MTKRRVLYAAGALLVATLLIPGNAAAHVANVEYRFPLPIWLFALAGATVVVATIPAAALAVRSRADFVGPDVYPFFRRARLGTIGLALATVLLVALLVGGFLSPAIGVRNPAVILFWIDFWVGLGILSALVGNVWDFVSPLSAAGRALDRMLGARNVAARAYPHWLGVWPSVAMLLALSWMELVWDQGHRPSNVATAAAIYLVAQLLAIGVYGSETWLARGELFTVMARTLARMAPLELYVRGAEGPCRASRCLPAGERVGCPSCWLDAEPSRRGVRVRPYGAGIRREPGLGAGGAAFVIALLATVVYDGFRSTQPSRDLDRWLVDLAPGLARADDARGTYSMLIFLAAFGSLFVAVMVFVARLEGVGFDDAVGRYAPTLIPIAAVYFIAHYFLYFLYVGQLTPVAVLDPLGRGWGPEYRPWAAVPGWLVWVLQAGFIVWGHVLAVVEAHRVSLLTHRRAAQAVRTQLPLAALMVAYTFAGLWVLGQALRAPDS